LFAGLFPYRGGPKGRVKQVYDVSVPELQAAGKPDAAVSRSMKVTLEQNDRICLRRASSRSDGPAESRARCTRAAVIVYIR